MELTIILLIIFTGFREWSNYNDKKDMLDRIMSRNYSEYKDLETPEDNKIEPEDDGLETLGDMKEELIDASEKGK